MPYTVGKRLRVLSEFKSVEHSFTEVFYIHV